MKISGRTGAAAVLGIGATIAIVVVSSCSQQAETASTNAEADFGCQYSLPGVAETLATNYTPPRWSVGETVVVRVEGRVRDFDDAPVYVVASWIIDDEGIRVTDAPALWIWQGGMMPRDTQPKSYYGLNDAAMNVEQAAFDARGEDSVRQMRRLRDARTFEDPYLETEPAAIKAIECLRVGNL